MKKAFLLSAAALMLYAFGHSPAAAARWCSVQNLGDMAENCHFQSRHQCQASLTGHSDFCRPYTGRRTDEKLGRSRERY